MSKFPILLSIWACTLLSAASPTVKGVEPPNWWANHTLNPIRLLIHGTGLTGASVAASAGFEAKRISVNERGTYLFVDLTIPPNVAAGSYPLTVKTADGQATVPFGIETPLSPEGRFAGFSPDDIIYLIMVDRFSNGDPSNDNPAKSPGLFGRTNPYLYHGGDFQGIINHLPYLKSLGITAIWLTPIYDNTNSPNQIQKKNGQASSDYHGYGTVDYYAVEEHFGTMDGLRKLVDEAHRNGIKVIQDQVANHVGPYHPWVQDSPTPTWFHGTASSHIDETWQIWSLPDPRATADMKKKVVDGWFMNVLPDMNQEDPEVARYEIQNALWWVGMVGFDAIRQDTLPYVPRAFWRDWSAALKAQYPHLNVVGEVFDSNPVVPSFFQTGVKRYDGVDSGIDSVFDFPDMFQMREVFAHSKSPEELSKVLAQDHLYPNPGILVPFLGNHDVKRFISEPGADAAGLKLAFTYLLTLRGTPELYYGDEIGMSGGDDPDNRHDFPGGWNGDRQNAFNPDGRTADQAQIFNYVQKLIAIRKNLAPLRNGKLVDLAVTAKTLAFARVSGSDTVIIALNTDDEAANIPIHYSGNGNFTGQLGNARTLAVTNGTGTVQLPPRSAEIFSRQSGSIQW